MEKERVLGVLVLVIMIISIISVSAGFWDIFKRGEGLEGELRQEPFNVTIQMVNSAPTIDSWTIPSPTTVTACSITTITSFTVNVSDPNGDADLEDGVVTVQFSNGTVDRPAVAATCTAGASDGDLILEFDCATLIDMQYYDEIGDWNITVTARDGPVGAPEALDATNSPQVSDGTVSYPFYPYGSMLAIIINDSNDPALPLDTLEWTAIQANSSDVEANNYLTVTNCGNIEVTASGTSWLSVKGLDLDRENPPPADYMEPDTFSVDETITPCNIGQLLDNQPVEADIVETNVTDATLSVGTDPAPIQVRDLYFCLEEINPSAFRGSDPITIDSYSTTAPDVWELDASQ